MKWKMKEARFGDIVRVSLGAIYHYGIFVSEEEVIQFGLPPTPNRVAEDVEVLVSPVSDFLAGGFLEVGCPDDRKEKKSRRSAKDTVASARARLGERGYDIIHNNCEHFANECAFGQKFSSMTDGLREKFRAMPIVHVYISKFPFSVEDSGISPVERAKEIESCSNERVKKQKYFVWKLLENALMRSLGLKLSKLNIRKRTNGKWECDECFFSLSHCDDFVAVAISRKSVGIDIEKCDPNRFTDALAEKISTVKEADEIARLTEKKGEALNVLWTKKEAVFKQLGEGAFRPKSIETDKFNTATKVAKSGEERYFITVANEDANKSVFRTTDDIELTDYNR